MPNLVDAIVLAFKAHENQVDRLGKPYIYHPLQVMINVGDSSESSDKAKIIAVLHDVLEDCPDYSPEYLLELGYDQEIVEALKLLSRNKNESYVAYINGLASNRLAVIVKIADLQHNLSRADQLPEKDRASLRSRYLKALEFLSNLP